LGRCEQSQQETALKDEGVIKITGQDFVFKPPLHLENQPFLPIFWKTLS
jgi:hypothetical protein